MNSYVRILNYNANADEIVSAGGRISTMEGTAEEIYARSCDAGTEKNRRLIGKVLSSGHTSVLEHISVNLAFENVSVFVEQFIIEFRLASFTVKSRRYVDFRSAGYYHPELPEAAAPVFDAQVQRLFGIYDELLQAGVPKEDARFVLPYCFCSNFFCTMNARELVHLMNEMVHGRGSRYPEIRALGESLYAQCAQELPYLALHKERAYAPVDLGLTGEPITEGAEPAVLLASTEHPESVITRAAFLELGLAPKELEPEEQKKLLAALLQRPRKRELEQANFTLQLNGLSLAALTHLTRHRMQSLVVPELVKTCSYERFVLPQSVVQSGCEELYRSAFRTAGETAARLAELGVRPEERSYLLLSGQTLPVILTMNAGELYTFFRLRCCSRAQWEIREIATAALRVLRTAHPDLFGLYGPTCFVTGVCPEGRMTCGQSAAIRERFSSEL